MEWKLEKEETTLLVSMLCISHVVDFKCTSLDMLLIAFFQAEVGRYQIGDREWEIYRVLLDEGNGSGPSRNKIVEAVWNMLMGWE